MFYVKCKYFIIQKHITLQNTWHFVEGEKRGGGDCTAYLNNSASVSVD
jgi:hypothetical protein